MSPLLVPASFVVGILIGLTSMGGAALMTPFLILVGGVRPAIAVGTDLAYAAITKWFGAGVHWRQGTVDLRMAGKLAAGSIPAGLFGVAAVVQLSALGYDVDLYLRRAIGVVLVVVAIGTLIRCFWDRLLPQKFMDPARLTGLCTVAWGALVGSAVGFTSVGSGSLIAPFLMMVYPRTPARVVGTDVFHAAILVTATAAAHSAFGNVDWRLASHLLLGSIPGVLLGSHLAPRLPERKLRFGLALMLLGSGVRMI